MTRLDDTAWMADGACLGHNPNLWHPIGRTDPNEALGKAICARCPVRSTCLNWAIETNQPDGTWGGLTVLERRHIDDGGLKQCTDCRRKLPPDSYPVNASGNLSARCYRCKARRARANRIRRELANA